MKPIDLFGDINAPHMCCQCCAGYCPAWESEPSEPQLYAVTGSDGVKYLSDRYVAVRADLMEPPQMDPVDATEMAPGGLQVPTAKTGPSRALFTATFLRRILAAGLTVHHSAEDAQYLYRGNEFVGWVMRRKEDNGKVGPAMNLSDVPSVRTYVDEAKRVGWRVPVVGDEWDAAASILNEAHKLWEGR